MSREEDLTPELKSLEATLASLRPTADELDRDKLMFAAGRESARAGPRRGRMSWPAALGAMTVVAAVLAVMLVTRPVRTVERIVYVPAPEAEPRRANSPTAEPNNHRAADGTRRVPGAGDGERGGQLPDRTPPGAEQDGPAGSLLAWLAGFPEQHFPRRSPTMRLFDEVMRQDAVRHAPAPSRTPEGVGRRVGSASYRQMLDSLLDEPGMIN